MNKMNKKLVSLLAGVAILGSATVASAHFQMIYTPESALKKGGTIPLKLVFTHPFNAKYTMQMEKPEQFFVIRSRGEGEPKRTDLLGTLKPTQWTSLTNSNQAWETTYKARGGDHLFFLVPAPYFEKSEDVYMQQNTKVIVNVGGEPGAWNEPVGAPAEIVPLVQPYNRWTGNIFQGQVLLNGKPVANTGVEVTFLNHDIQLESNAFAKEPEVEDPQGSFGLTTILTDDNGVFTFGIPRAGWWGFAALDLDPDFTYKGKTCTRDAVIWIQSRDMK